MGGLDCAPLGALLADLWAFLEINAFRILLSPNTEDFFNLGARPPTGIDWFSPRSYNLQEDLFSASTLSESYTLACRVRR